MDGNPLPPKVKVKGLAISSNVAAGGSFKRSVRRICIESCVLLVFKIHPSR